MSSIVKFACSALICLSLVASVAVRTAAANPYIHYMAQDMSPEKGDWISEHAIKRMYWHPVTAGGPGATVQVESSVWPKHWSWFPLRHVGNGYFYGERWSSRLGLTYHEQIYVYRFAPSSTKTHKRVSNVYDLAPFAFVSYKIGRETSLGWDEIWKDRVSVILESHDSGGWKVN